MPRWVLVVLVVLGLLAPATQAAAGSSGPPGLIVFCDAYGGSGLYTIRPDGTGRDHIVDEPDSLRPRWAPDGSGIAYTDARRFASHRVRWVDADGSNPHTLIGPNELPEGWFVTSLAFSPDGQWFVLALTDENFVKQRLYVAPRNGSSMDLVATNASDPDWSSTDRILATRNGGIVTMDPDGSNVVVAVENGRNEDPRWSPDGSRIVFMRVIHRWADIAVVDADGTNMVNLTNSPRLYDWSPAYSPTGRHIVWSVSTEIFEYADLWRMRSDGTGRTRLTTTKAIDEYEPDWYVPFQ